MIFKNSQKLIWKGIQMLKNKNMRKLLYKMKNTNKT